MIKPGDIIKHEEFTDVAIIVKYAGVVPKNGSCRIEGQWVNLGVHKSYPMHLDCDIQVLVRDLPHWLVCDDTFVGDCLRDAEWTKIGTIS